MGRKGKPGSSGVPGGRRTHTASGAIGLTEFEPNGRHGVLAKTPECTTLTKSICGIRASNATRADTRDSRRKSQHHAVDSLPCCWLSACRTAGEHRNCREKRQSRFERIAENCKFYEFLHVRIRILSDQRTGLAGDRKTAHRRFQPVRCRRIIIVSPSELPLCLRLPLPR